MTSESDGERLEPIRRTVSVAAMRARAFRVFVERMAEWWPREYTWGQDDVADVRMEPRQGGRWFEVRRDGGEALWGVVLEWDPPERVALSWRIRPNRTPETDPARASHIDVRFFEDVPGETRLELTHDGFARHGAGAAEYRAGMAAPEGWTLILKRYEEMAE